MGKRLTQITGQLKVVILALCLATTYEASAQSNVDGAIAGTVGSKNAASTVVLESPTTGTKRVLTPSASGAFRAGSLPPGNYVVKFTAADGQSVSRTVAVSIGSTSTVDFAEDDVMKLQKFVVSGSSISPVDFAKTNSTVILSKQTIDELPVIRSQTAVALLTPGTVQGDNQFNLVGVGKLASFGGASVAENAYYINGFNLTNFRNGLGGSNVPFDFYDQFEVIDGAYSAEYGRATGFVINATTKRGTNEYKAEANVVYRPNGWTSPDVYFTDETGARQLSIYNGEDYRESKEYNIIASGPLIKNKLFFAGLINGTKTNARGVSGAGTTLVDDTIDNPFYALKIDAEPFQGQHLEYTYFTDKEDTIRNNYHYSFASKTADRAPYSTNYLYRGGKNNIYSYTGVFFEDLTVHALYGDGKFDRTNGSPQSGKPYVLDARGPLSASPKVIQGVSSVVTALDERKAKRLDLEYAFHLLGDHRLRVGYDSESNTSLDDTQYGGGARYVYATVTPGNKVQGVTVPAGVTELISKRIYKTGGSFKVDSDAYYLEDAWSLMDERLLLRLGYRQETFENFNAEGKSFIKVANQKSPRLGISYDLFGNKRTKVFANYGRYYLPVATNTNIRLAGAQFDQTTYYYPGGGTNADGSPTVGAQFSTSLTSPGTVPDTTSVVDKNLTPMYQDEYVIGIQHELNKNWRVDFKGVYRNLGSSFDDAIVDQGLNAYAAAHGLPDQTDSYQYVLINPGKSVTINWDFGDGVKRLITIPNSDLGYPEAVRKYYAAEFVLEKIWDGKWSARFSYVWSQNYGNTEGLVLSDNGQTDAGITQQFDTPLLTQNTYGKLPNDRRHVFKAFGSYALTEELTIGSQMYLSSGKPINSIGALTDPIADFYGAAYLLVPRGSAGTTPWVFNADLSLNYRPTWGKGALSFQVDVFNVFNGKTETAVDEYSTNDEQTPSASYLSATDFQTPRYIQFQVSVSF